MRHTFSSTDALGTVGPELDGVNLLVDNPNVALVILRASDAAATWGVELQSSFNGDAWDTLDTYSNTDDTPIPVRLARGLRYRLRLSTVVSAGTLTVTVVA